MERLLEVVSRNYDYVVIDLPPLAPVVDVRAIARMVDGFVYVIEWGKTSTSTVQQAMQTVPALGDKMLGVVLNKTNMQALRLYSKNEAGNEYYDYHRFSAYTEGH
jgi:succinoglycan biosynthesis transport protein ExoP